MAQESPVVWIRKTSRVAIRVVLVARCQLTRELKVLRHFGLELSEERSVNPIGSEDLLVGCDDLGEAHADVLHSIDRTRPGALVEALTCRDV